VFQNSVLRTIFGPERDEVTKDWRKLHNDELHVYQILLGRTNQGISDGQSM
jgi:hypothetical protein